MDGKQVWQVGEARRRLKDIIDAAIKDGPQLIRRRNDDVVVIVSVTDWSARHQTLKDWLLSDQGRTDDLLFGGGEATL
jgi:prevent-host-death family protein